MEVEPTGQRGVRPPKVIETDGGISFRRHWGDTYLSVQLPQRVKARDLQCARHGRLLGGSVAEWLARWTQALNGLGSDSSRDAVG